MALVCDKITAILSTELDGKLMVAYCNTGCLPTRTQQLLGEAPHHKEFKSAVWHRSHRVCSRFAMLNNLEKVFFTRALIEKYDRMQQFALGGTTAQLVDVRKFIPCKVQTERLQVGVSELVGWRLYGHDVKWNLTAEEMAE